MPFVWIFLAFMLAACQERPNETTQQSDVVNFEEPEGVQPETSLPEEAENTDEAIDGAVQLPSDDEVEAQTSTAEQTLIEDMGFSTPEELTIEEPAVASEAVLFCLNQKQESSSISGEQACKKISSRLASVSEKSCNAARLQESHCLSVDGFPILFREYPPLPGRDAQGKILVIGGIHGDELTSVSIVFKWIEKLNKFHSGLFHWHVVPMMNPDGVLPRSAQRTNKNGVDLNRNLPSDDWAENALKYWRDKQGENPRRYPGEKPASEPETQWLIDVINEFKPDAIISVHAPYGVVDFDALVLNTAPKSLGKLHLNLLGTYPGSLGNYAGINRDIPVITLELPHAWDMPSEQETTQIWEDIVSWLRKNVNQDVAQSGD